MTPSTVALSPDQKAIVQAILSEHLPPTSQVWVFGSRATGKHRPYSDLDLAVKAPQQMPLFLCAALASAFEESLLPFTVDVVDMNTVKDPLKTHIYEYGLPWEGS
ncbi:MAG: nucleotidyltransferase family protein [Alphaproteobacteria bacterium]